MAKMKLFEPITINGLQLKNRLIMPGMGVMPSYRGKHTAAYYAERARGGVGAITASAQSVDLLSSDKVWGGKEGAAKEYAMGQRRVVDAVHEFGAKMGAQIINYERISPQKAIWEAKGDWVAPSAGRGRRALTLDEIEGIIQKYVVASTRIREAGYDYLEFHCAHGFMPNQFFSPVANRRTDRYGGSVQKRMTFFLEVVTAMRRALGNDFPILCRLGAESKKLGITVADAGALAVELEKAGINALSVTTGEPGHPPGYNPRPGRWTTTYHYKFSPCPSVCYPEGVLVHVAAAIKPRLHIPVITVGRLQNIQLIEDILSRGKADMIALGRQLIADPYWPKKVAAGELDDIRPCLGCNSCLDGARTDSEPRCAVNAALGREKEYELQPAAKPKRVFVIGGGPGGMEAARTAALRGHKVTIYEKSPTLGKKLLYAAHPPQKKQITGLRDYLERQVRKAGVEVKTGVVVNAGLVIEGKPDEVIVATGAGSLIPPSVRHVLATLLSPTAKWWEMRKLGLRGRYANNRLYRELEGKVPVHVIGDASKPGGILEAIDGGARAGREI